MSIKLKKLLIGAAIISLSSATLVIAQPFGGRGGNLINELNLDQNQQQQVQTIMDQQRKESKQWRQKHRQETENKLSTVLNAEQMEKFKTLKQNRGKSKCRKMKQPM